MTNKLCLLTLCSHGKNVPETGCCPGTTCSFIKTNCHCPIIFSCNIFAYKLVIFFTFFCSPLFLIEFNHHCLILKIHGHVCTLPLFGFSLACASNEHTKGDLLNFAKSYWQDNFLFCNCHSEVNVNRVQWFLQYA